MKTGTVRTGNPSTIHTHGETQPAVQSYILHGSSFFLFTGRHLHKICCFGVYVLVEFVLKIDLYCIKGQGHGHGQDVTSILTISGEGGFHV